MERKRGDTQQGEGETEVSLQWLEQKPVWCIMSV